MRAPRKTPMTTVAAVPARRSRKSSRAPAESALSITCLMKDFREVPSNTGRPNSVTMRSNLSINWRFCSGVLPNPTPGSGMIRSPPRPATKRLLNRPPQSADHFGEDVLDGLLLMHHPWRAARMHQHQRGAGLRRDLGHGGIEPESADVV